MVTPSMDDGPGVGRLNLIARVLLSVVSMRGFYMFSGLSHVLADGLGLGCWWLAGVSDGLGPWYVTCARSSNPSATKTEEAL